MIGTQSSLDVKLEQLAEQVRTLAARVDELARQMAGAPAAFHEPDEEPEMPDPLVALTDGRLQSAAQNMLPGLATVCFLLVFALVLRTVADNGVVNRPAGLALGLVYATLLVVYGYCRSAKAVRRGAVYATCGILLVLSIAFEGYVGFDVLSPSQAYLLLGVTSVAVVAAGGRWRLSAPTCVGLFGGALVALALEFPEPHFPYVAVLLLVANVAAYALGKVPRCAWLKWGLLTLSLSFWFLWSVKASVALTGARASVETVSVWLVPWLFAYAILYLAFTVQAATRRGGRFGGFESLLPAVTAFGGSGVAVATLLHGTESDARIALAGVLSAAVYLILALRLDGRTARRARAAAAFALPGVVLLAVWLPMWLESRWAVTGVWTASALGVAVVSWRWRDRNLRMASHVLQAYACGFAVFWAGLLSIRSEAPVQAAAGALLLGALCAGHYAWSRRKRIRHARGYIQIVDPNDRIALLPFLASVAYAFAAGRLLLFASLQALDYEAPGAFQSGQSVLINGGAVLVALLALRLRFGELLVVAALIAVGGASKVFVYDLMNVRGVPLVLSVFSFGMASALGSIIWTRWQRKPQQADVTSSIVL